MPPQYGSTSQFNWLTEKNGGKRLRNKAKSVGGFMKCNFEYYQMVYPKIIEAIRLAAAPSKIQESLFPQNDDPTGEIADTVEEAARYSRILTDNSYLSQEQFEKIEALDNLFESFIGEDWTVLSMHNSTKWAYVRDFAMDTLHMLSVEYAAPNLYWIREIH
jgi:hypothetical protein